MPARGDVLHITKAASVQFEYRPILFRVIRISLRSTYIGWVWLEGYEIDTSGEALERRTIFVQTAGLWPATIRGHE